MNNTVKKALTSFIVLSSKVHEEFRVSGLAVSQSYHRFWDLRDIILLTNYLLSLVALPLSYGE